MSKSKLLIIGALLNVFGTACSPMPTISKNRPSPAGPELRFSQKRFASCDEIVKAVAERMDAKRSEEAKYEEWVRSQPPRPIAIASELATPMAESQASSDSGGAGGQAQTPARAGSITNNQEREIDEADLVKADDRRLYVLANKRLLVLDRATKDPIGKIDISGLAQVSLHSTGSRLIVLGQKLVERTLDPRIEPFLPFPVDPVFAPTNIAPAAVGQSPAVAIDDQGQSRAVDPIEPASLTPIRIAETHTVAILLDTRAAGVPTEIHRKTVKGQLVDARLLGKRLYTVVSREDLTRTYPVVKEGTIDDVPCERFYPQIVSDFDFRTTHLYAVDTETPEKTTVTAFLGGGDSLYMTENALYLVKSNIRWFWWDSQVAWDQTIVTKAEIDPATGEAIPVATGQARGQIYNRFALKELKDQKALAIATTLRSQNWLQENQLTLLSTEAKGGKLAERSRTPAFAPNENIRSVRYIGTKAYVVTFRNTDPLFVIDLANADSPKMLGELKVPGFSAYLHPAGNGRLIGVGTGSLDPNRRWETGVQVSLFDISNDEKPLAIEQKVFGLSAQTEVSSDHHAFYYDGRRERIGVPYAEHYTGCNDVRGLPHQDKDPIAPACAFPQSGALVIDVKTGVKEIARLSHQSLMPSACLSGGAYQQKDIHRLFDLDGDLITLSSAGLQVHDVENPTTVKKTVTFGMSASDCYSWEK